MLSIPKHLRRIVSQPFIAATGLAALIHSTWSLGTFFSGDQPSDPVRYAMWLIPAFLIAFSLDVGQLATSAEIRDGQRSRMKYLTFAVFAGATYYLQFVFIASHMPTVPLSPGVRLDWGPLISFVRDAAVFVIPLLLPLSTTLYTFSQDGPTARAATMTIRQTTKTEVKVEKPAATPLATVDAPQIAPPSQDAIAGHAITCEICGWHAIKDTKRGATNALVAHNRHHHPAVVENVIDGKGDAE